MLKRKGTQVVFVVLFFIYCIISVSLAQDYCVNMLYSCETNEKALKEDSSVKEVLDVTSAGGDSIKLSLESGEEVKVEAPTKGYIMYNGTNRTYYSSRDNMIFISLPNMTPVYMIRQCGLLCTNILLIGFIIMLYKVRKKEYRVLSRKSLRVLTLVYILRVIFLNAMIVYRFG